MALDVQEVKNAGAAVLGNAQVKSIGMAIAQKIYYGLKDKGKVEAAQIEKAFESFIERAERDKAGGLARQMLDQVDVLGEESFSKISSSSFENANLFKLSGVHDGSGSMEPHSLELAVKFFWAETAASGAHTEKTYFTDDPIPRLTLAITTIATRAFRFRGDITAKKEWISLLKVLLHEIRRQDCVSSKESFAHAVTSLHDRLENCVNELQAEENKRSVSKRVESIRDTASNIVSLMGSVIGEVHQAAGSWWQFTKEQKEENQKKQTAVHIGVVDGSTEFDYITFCQQLLGLFNNGDNSLQTEKYFITDEVVTTIQGFLAFPSLLTQEEKQVIASLLEQCPKEPKEKGGNLHSCNQKILRELTSVFSTSFLRLLKDKQISIHGKKGICCVGKKKPSLFPNLGIHPGFLKLSDAAKNRINKEHGVTADNSKYKQAANREQQKEEAEIPEFLVELVMRQVRLTNVVTSLRDVMGIAQKFMESHGSDGAALFLQKFSPAVKILIASVQQEHGHLGAIMKELALRNHELETKHSTNNLALETIGNGLAKMASLMEGVAETIKNDRDAIRKGETSIERDIGLIVTSLESCHSLFSSSKLLNQVQEANLSSAIQGIRSEKERAQQLDAAQRSLAGEEPEKVSTAGTSPALPSQTVMEETKSSSPPPFFVTTIGCRRS